MGTLQRNGRSRRQYPRSRMAGSGRYDTRFRRFEYSPLCTQLILLQDGLFAAFLSAFLVFTIPQLQPSSTDIALDVLLHISQQLSNSTTPPYAPAEFTVSPNIAAVNVLLFLSLALVLIDAFLAMLVKGWLQEFDRGWRKYTVANFRAQERERRLRGLERWKLAELVGLLPILIQTSLLFFCVGLIVLLFPIHLTSAIFSLVALVAGLTFYGVTTYVSVFDAYAPFSSPVSRGLIILIDVLQTTWIIVIRLITRHFQHIISAVSFHISHPSLPREHEANTSTSTQSLPGNSGVVHSLLPQDNMGVEKRGVVARSHSQIDPQTSVSILERLVTTTAEAVENIPVFLDLLDQPLKDPTLRPSSIEKWKDLLHTTLRLLGDPSTFSDSVARTIARSVLFCYNGKSADQQLSRRLKYHFDHICSGQTSEHMPLNSLFATYLHYYCAFSPVYLQKVDNAIAFLEPSNAADAELLWMVNTIHKNLLWKYHPLLLYSQPLKFFAAVLTYVSSTEQSRRSQVPLTAAVIYAMHTIKSALETGGIDSIDAPYALPGPVLTTSKSKSMTFHPVNAVDLWSGDCVDLASALLQPDTHWVGCSDDDVWKFQLALIAALYIDSTKQAGHAPAAFSQLLKLTNIPGITMRTWVWADAYDQTKLAGYWYMALFKEPIYQKASDNSPVRDIGYIIMQTINRCSEVTLSALHLLDISAKHLCIQASSSSNLLIRAPDGDLCLIWTAPDGAVINYAYMPFNLWILFHLDTLFSQGSILHQGELEQLEWTGTPEQVHVALARLTLYDSLQGGEDKETKQLELKLFLKSKDYAVCTGAFKCCLNLISPPNSPGDTHCAEMFIPETMGCQWAEDFIQVLCGTSIYESDAPWEFLTEHLAPKWALLPHSWCRDFASVFLFFNVHPLDMDELPAYQWFAFTLSREGQTNQDFLPFLGTMLELIKHIVTSDQVTSLETWLVQLPEILKNQDAHIKLGNVLATRKQEIVDETLRFFAELPMEDPDWINDVQ